ncbi:hypothetical protein N0V82_002394 [Gnomoniopsis sp. IMI 355080]|nr:hypothetical protein N0V82_002394 [Gnomoniopsis sp. IMI 355080]
MISSYDFVIIGGGTAGLVVAARLTEVESISVLVLEAGGDLADDPRVKIPIFYAALLGSEHDWSFRSEPQEGLNGRVIGLNQGKALGGSSALNAHVFVPPHGDVIDSWETLGNTGWTWDMLKEYSSKSYSSPSIPKDTEKRLAIEHWPASLKDQAKGPIQTSYGNSEHPIREAWAKTFRAAQQEMQDNPFVQPSIGSFSSLASIDPVTCERSYSASAYYQSAKQRSSLHVLTNAHVEKILFEEGSATSPSKRAMGVQYMHNGEIKTASVNKEVILAAGVFQSPKILELSGIGNEELLQRYGIDVVEDLPGVGENLQDHLISYTAFEANDSIETKDALVRQEPEAIGLAMQEYAATQSGPLASLGVHTYAYLPLPAKEQADLKTLLGQTCGKGHYARVTEAALLDPQQPSAAYLTALGQTNFPLDLADPTKTPAPSAGKFITFGVMLSRPLSRGSVHLTSTTATEPPVIDPKYLSNPIDVEVLARHMLCIKSLAASPAMRPLLAQPLKFRDPAADFNGDLNAAKAYARANLVSMWHFAGTCAMLPREQKGVLDARLRVYGVQGLRVVDASAIPLLSTANLQATVYAVAERAADLIKGDWGLE